MGLAAPIALLFAALGLPVLALYMLKLRRQQKTVSSTMLWKRTLRDWQANAPWQRLRRHLLLLLQLLALLLLVLSLARPYSRTDRPLQIQDGTTILLDASASMGATDVFPSRFEAARTMIESWIAQLGSGDTISLIAVGEMPHLLASRSSDRATLRRALASAQLTNAEADWEAALALANSIARAANAHTTVILSDGGFGEVKAGVAPSGQIVYLPIGVSGENQALSALTIRDTSRGLQAFVRVTHAGNSNVTLRLTMYVDEALFDVRILHLEPQSHAEIIVTGLPSSARVVEARLERELAYKRIDWLAVDDAAWAITPNSNTEDDRSALLITPGNLFIARALNLLPGLETTVVPVTRTQPTEPISLADPSMAALYIYDRVLPTRLPDAGAVLFVAPPTSTPWFQVTGIVTRTQIVRTAQTSPLLRHVDLDDVRISHAQKLEAPPWAEVLVEAGGGPLLLAGEMEGRRIAVLAFDLQHSDLPLQVAFPILISNLVDWLAPAAIVRGPSGEAIHQLSPGTPVLLYPPQEDAVAPPLQIVGPDEKAWVIDGQSPVPFAETHTLGLYRIERPPSPAGSEEKGAKPGSNRAAVLDHFAVNLFAERESRIAPKDSIILPSTAAPLPVHTAQGDSTGQHEWWRWASLAGIVVLLVEWGVDKISRTRSRGPRTHPTPPRPR